MNRKLILLGIMGLCVFAVVGIGLIESNKQVVELKEIEIKYEDNNVNTVGGYVMMTTFKEKNRKRFEDMSLGEVLDLREECLERENRRYIGYGANEYYGYCSNFLEWLNEIKIKELEVRE